MLCDLCKQPIERFDPYALTEYGRTHATCLRARATGALLGPRNLKPTTPPEDCFSYHDSLAALFLDPVYVYRNLYPYPPPLPSAAVLAGGTLP